MPLFSFGRLIALCSTLICLTIALPPGAASAAPALQADGTIVDLVAEDDDLATLSGVLMAAGQISTLGSEGPFTLFAPSQTAFAGLTEAEFEELLADPEGELTAALQYHVVPGLLTSADMTDGLEVESVAGPPLRFALAGETLQVNGTPLVRADIAASNGVIHVVDRVLTPADLTALAQDDAAQDYADASAEEASSSDESDGEEATTASPDETSAAEDAAEGTAEGATNEATAEAETSDVRAEEAASMTETPAEEEAAVGGVTEADSTPAATPAPAGESEQNGGLPWWLWLLLALLLFGLLYWFFRGRKTETAVDATQDATQASPAPTSEPAADEASEASAAEIAAAAPVAEAATTREAPDAAEAEDEPLDDAQLEAPAPILPHQIVEPVADEDADIVMDDGVEQETIDPTAEVVADDEPEQDTVDAATDTVADVAAAAQVEPQGVDGPARAVSVPLPDAEATAEEVTSPLIEDDWRYTSADATNHPDDLTQILGIGRVYEGRLFAAGVATWDQVATMSVDALTEITQAVPGANVPDWPRQAAGLAQSNDRVGARYDGPLPQKLSLIPGISEATEQLLYRHGVTTYARLAGLTPAELAQIAPDAAGASERDRWIEVAQLRSQRG